MKNNKKQIIMLIVIMAVLILIIFIESISGVNNRIIKTITNNGFKLEAKNLYRKDDEEYPLDKCEASYTDCVGNALFFNSENYTLYQSKTLKESGVTYDFIPIYSFKTGKFTYTYRINYQNGVVIFKGEYHEDKKDYSCDIEYSYGININNNYNEFCATFKEELNNFYNINKSLFKDNKLLDKMKDN